MMDQNIQELTWIKLRKRYYLAEVCDWHNFSRLVCHYRTLGHTCSETKNSCLSAKSLLD